MAGAAAADTARHAVIAAAAAYKTSLMLATRAACDQCPTFSAARGKLAGGTLMQGVKGIVAFPRILKTIKTQRHPLAERAPLASMTWVHELRREPAWLVPCRTRHALAQRVRPTALAFWTRAQERLNIWDTNNDAASNAAGIAPTKTPKGTTG